MRTDLVQRLLAQGNRVEIEAGKLIIKPASGKPVPDEWYENNHKSIIDELIRKIGRDALLYLEYSVGSYHSKGRFNSGLTMQFMCLLSGDNRYCIFNVDLQRKRNTKHGKAGNQLPKGQFRVGQRSAFYRFWQSTGLVHPPRLSSYHDYMGNLKGLVYSAEAATSADRIQASTLRPLVVSYDEVLVAYGLAIPYSVPTTSRQMPDNGQTRMPYKDMAKAQYSQGLSTDSTAGVKGYDTSQQESAGARNRCLPPGCTKPPEEQTTGEWLYDYGY